MSSGSIAARRPRPRTDHVLELRALAANALDLLELAGVLAKDHAGSGVGEHVLALLGGVRVVDRRHDRTGAERAHVDERPFGSRVGENRHAIAGLEAQRDQPARNVALGARKLAIRHLLRPVTDTVAERRPGVLLARPEHEFAQRPGVRRTSLAAMPSPALGRVQPSTIARRDPGHIGEDYAAAVAQLLTQRSSQSSQSTPVSRMYVATATPRVGKKRSIPTAASMP